VGDEKVGELGNRFRFFLPTHLVGVGVAVIVGSDVGVRAGVSVGVGVKVG
jgi:hypothetical protein